MTAYLKRLLTTGAAYQASSLLASALAVFTLPLYTRHLTTAEYGYAETLLVFIILTSILLRAGIGEAFVRFWFDDDDHERRIRLARSTTGYVLLASTAAAALGVAFAGPAVRAPARPPRRHADVVRPARAVGLHEPGGRLRAAACRGASSGLPGGVEHERRCSPSTLTIVLVVVLDEGARGYVLGNYAASAVVLVGHVAASWCATASASPGRAGASLPR